MLSNMEANSQVKQPISFRLPVDLYEKLRTRAFETREPMNAILITALEKHLKERKS